MDEIQQSQGYGATKRKQFTFYHLVYILPIPGTQLINLGRMKGGVDLGATQWF